MTRDFHGCKAAIFFDDLILAHLRDHADGIPFPGYWDLPGGGRENAETPEQTMARELHEEFGLCWSKAEVLWQVRSPAVHHPGAKVIFFVARMAPDHLSDLHFGDEGDGWALMRPDAFLARDRVVPSHGPRMRQYLSLAGQWGSPT